MRTLALRTAPFLFLTVLGGFACGPAQTTTNPPPVDAGALPPAICKTPGPTPTDSAWFTEVTADVGLAKQGDFEPVATGIVAGDLDGDGYQDFIASFFPSPREPKGTKRTRFLFMNRPSKDDPSQRVFVDMLDDSGLMATRGDGNGARGWSLATLSDLDNDGDLDAILCPGGADPSQILDPCDAFINDGTAHFTLADPSDLDKDLFWTTGAAALDFDRDGIVDFYPGTSGLWPNGATKQSAPRLYKGAGDGTFSNVAATVGLPTLRTSATNWRSNMGVTACDLDGDGDLDLLTANYGRTPNEVFLNKAGSFAENGVALGIAYDDRQDYSDDQAYRCWCSDHAGKCPANVEAPNPMLGCRGWNPGWSDKPWGLGGNNWAISCADLDDDGDMDLVTAETRHPDVGLSSDESEILLNDMQPGGPLGKFRRPGNDKTGMARVFDSDQGDNSAIIADLDNDGRKDIYLASSNYPGTHAWIFHQKADGTFEDVTKTAKGWHMSTEGPAMIDIDNDGDLDVVAGSGTFNYAASTNAIHVYRNDIGQDANSTRIRLAGKGAGFANRRGVGARVKIVAGGRTQWFEVKAQHAHTQSDVQLDVGLGGACTIDEIEVRWPNQALTKTVYKNVLANYPIELGEDGALRYVTAKK